MKVDPSPLVSGLRGKGGGAVGFRWRGVIAVRGYNPKPANPNTSGQQLARASMAVLTHVWKHMNTKLHDSWDEFAKGLPRSGFNCFVKQNAALQIADTWLKMTPSEPEVRPIGALANVSLDQTAILVSWKPLDANPSFLPDFYVWKDEHPLSKGAVVEADAVMAASFVGSMSVQTGSFAVTGLESGQDYVVGAAVRDGVTGKLSISSMLKFATT